MYQQTNILTRRKITINKHMKSLTKIFTMNKRSLSDIAPLRLTHRAESQVLWEDLVSQ